MAHDAIQILTPLAHSKSMTLRLDIPDMIPRALVDKDLTKQCLINLMENAMKYSPPDREVRLRISETSDTVRADIIDEGYGIKAEDLEHIFEKFFRSSAEETEGIKGSGLGLTFVKEAVEAQGGSISITSTHGKGSTFSLFFPKTEG
jgi:signal transduction histidine kinase